MNNELLNKILPYCGYGLKAINEDYIVDVVPSHCGTDLINAEMLCTPDRAGIFHYKPILFPFDCITKEIETKHGKEIPLSELWKICYAKEQLLDDPSFKTGKYDSRISCNGLALVFNYRHGFYTIQHSEVYFAENQWKLFQYLYSRHIAFNLLPDEYVNVDSLDVNPYLKGGK